MYLLTLLWALRQYEAWESYFLFIPQIVICIYIVPATVLISEDAMKRKCRLCPFGVIRIYAWPSVHIISVRWNLQCWWLHSTDGNTEAKSQETGAKAGGGVKSNSQVAWVTARSLSTVRVAPISIPTPPTPASVSCGQCISHLCLLDVSGHTTML